VALHYFALDMRDDRVLIEEYEHWHRPTMVRSLRNSGINDLEPFRCGNTW